MAENKNGKKKTTTTKKNVNSKPTTTAKKGTNATRRTRNTAAKKATKKVQAKKTTTNKTTQVKKTTQAPKPKVVQETPKKVVEQVKPIPKEEIKKQEELEKTLIFDGRQNKNLVEVVEKLEEKNVVLEDKVIKRSNIKRVAIIILTALIFIILAVTVWYAVDGELTARENNQTINSNIYKKVYKNYKTISEINKQEEKDKKDQQNAAHSIKEIEYSNIETISLADFERKILEKEDFTVLIASSTCYPCLNFEPIINEVYKEREATIYRINISMLTENEITRFRTYYAFKLTPTIFTLKEGVVVADRTGSSTKEELISWLDENV